MPEGVDAIRMIWLVVALVIVGSALFARRVSLGFLVRSVLGWLLLIAGATFAVTHRHALAGLFERASATLGADEQQVDGGVVRIRMADDGHFWAKVRINGVQRRMLIDSGATITAISAATADAAGIEAGGALPVMIETANGTVPASRGRIDRLSIGSLSTRDLGVVISDRFGPLDVLGMNFLSRLHSWRVEDNVLILEPRRDGDARKRANGHQGAQPTDDKGGDN